MSRHPSVTVWAGVTAAALVTSLALASPSVAADPVPEASDSTAAGSGTTAPETAPPDTAPPDGGRHTGPDYNAGKPIPLDVSASTGINRRRSLPEGTATAGAAVGDTRTWVALDDVEGTYYLKDYTLRGLGKNVQVWVADDREFPEGDCRNTLGLTRVTDAQVRSFVKEFDTRIYPIESRAFSTPPARDGSGGAALAEEAGLPADYWKVPKAQADDIVTLLDNVRDTNFYEPNTPEGQNFVGGFFYSEFNEQLDRNVMTVDAFDWLHLSGANPADDSATPAYVACAAELGQAPGAADALGTPRPRTYEGTFAHEYQHLLHSYEDPDETLWVDEGLSDWARTLLGYVDPRLAPDNPKANLNLACFQGFQDFGGPENSLTAWGDQGDPEIRCDYGAAYSMMEYLQSHYGNAFMRALHREDANGLAGLGRVLTRFGARVTAQETLHRWAATVALDQAIEQSRGRLRGGDPSVFSASSLSARVNWNNPQAYDSPGAPTNGSDYVRLRTAGGTPLNSSRIGSITFAGARTLEPTPVEWSAAATPPSTVTEATTCGEVPAGVGPGALYSGCGESLDRSLVRQVTVPASGGALTFDALWDIEESYDFGYAQVSADGGRTWQSLSTADTTDEAAEDTQADVVANLPGLTGTSDSWRSQSASLDAWKGKQILVGFRYLTDTGVNEAGWWVRNITAAGTTLPSTLAGWQTITQARPEPVAGWTVQLVSYGAKGAPHIHRLKLNGSAKGAVIGRQVRAALGRPATTVAAIVTYDDPGETSSQYARYALKVNGVTQPGG
jgi:hypothetical protein